MKDAETKQEILNTIDALHRKIDIFRQEMRSQLTAVDDTLSSFAPPLLNRRSGGFTLVELAIVLVIIGLLAGGVLLGKNLIRNADLQTVVTDFSRYKNAASQFREKYLALPGDFAEATAMWGEDAAACNTAAADGNPGTCNGNGDGRVFYAAVAGGTGEEFQFWKQLQLEGLIQGNYTGVAGLAALDDRQPGVNVPKATLGADGFFFTRLFGDLTGAVTGSLTSSFALHYGATIEAFVASTFIPKEAWGIDTKIDDGKPASGNLIGRGWNNCTTATARTDLAAEYNLAGSTPSCHFLIWRNAF